MVIRTYYDEELYHHGIRGQKWGKRNGPPYPLSGGQLSYDERKKSRKDLRISRVRYNKKHVDKTISVNDTLSTLSYNKDRLQGADMFYATYKALDKHQYGALFNKKIPQDVLDDDGNVIGTAEVYKFKINTKLKSDMKVASEDSGAKVFLDLYKKDRDFYNFVTDENRMRNYFVEDKYKFKGYRESRDVLDKMKNTPDYIPTDKEVSKLYRMFNYTIPFDGAGDNVAKKDMETQRTKFFNECKKNGYGAVLDTNDAIYGAFHAEAPVIVFDMEQIFSTDVYRTNAADKIVSTAAFSLAKTLGL